jgi:hypothetical protein
MKRLLRNPAGFILFEVMCAVTIFVIGVLALGHCVENCLKAEIMKEDDARARRVLENRMLEIEAGAVLGNETTSEELKGPFAGMTLKTKRDKQKFKNEKEVDFEIDVVKLEVLWKQDGRENSRELEFYVRPTQR